VFACVFVCGKSRITRIYLKHACVLSYNMYWARRLMVTYVRWGTCTVLVMVYIVSVLIAESQVAWSRSCLRRDEQPNSYEKTSHCPSILDRTLNSKHVAHMQAVSHAHVYTCTNIRIHKQLHKGTRNKRWCAAPPSHLALSLLPRNIVANNLIVNHLLRGIKSDSPQILKLTLQRTKVGLSWLCACELDQMSV